MSCKAKSSQPSVASLLLLSLAIAGSICLWCDRDASFSKYPLGNYKAEAKPDRQTQAKIIQVDSIMKLTTKLENLL